MPTLPAVEVQDSVIDDFRGPWLRPQSTDVPASEALLSLNAEYGPHFVGTRFGFGRAWDPAQVFTTVYNWIKGPDINSSAGNILLVYDLTAGLVGIIPNLSTFINTALFSVANAEGISVAEAGNRVYIAVFKSNGTGVPTPIGASQAAAATSGGVQDFAFMGGSVTFPSLSLTFVGGATSLTTGIHSVGYVLTSVSGFQGPVCPVGSNGLFNPASQINVTAVGDAINFSLTFTPPVGAAFIQVVISPVSNPYQFFLVPGLVTALTPGVNVITSQIALYPDAQIIATFQDVTANQYLLTQTTGGTGPFSPFKVIEYGTRIAYLTYDSAGNPAVYVSDPGNPEHITELYHKLKLPGVRQITSGFVLRGILYILGPNWTYGFQDTGGQPATWPQPTLVDGAFGTPSCLGVVVNASKDWAIIASKVGLFLFNGQYADNPLTYMLDEDWRRINWGASQTIRISDNQDKKQILLVVPLDGAATPNFIMCFDYTDGLDYQSIKYSLWNITGYNPRGLCTVQHPTTGRMETWITPNSTTLSALRQMNDTDDTSPYSDWVGGVSQTIPFSWECAPQPEGSIGQIMAHPGGYVRAVGKGNLTAITFNLDRTKQANWTKPVALAVTPGIEYFRQFYVTSERASVRFNCGVNPGDYVILSGYRHRYYPWALRR